MRKIRLKPILYIVILGTILTGAYLMRIAILEDKPRYFLFHSYINRIFILAIVCFALESIDNRIIKLFSYERAINFLLDSVILASIWLYPGIAYSVSTLSNLVMVFAMLWLFGAVAFDSSKISIIILGPFFLCFLFFFDPVTTQKGASLYWSAFTGFGVKTGLVLLSYIAYRYIIKSNKMDTDVALLLLGWFVIFSFSHLSAIDLGPFSLKRFISFAYFKSIVYVFWLIVLICRWRKVSYHGVLAK